jgi:hypothetical protein
MLTMSLRKNDMINKCKGRLTLKLQQNHHHPSLQNYLELNKRHFFMSRLKRTERREGGEQVSLFKRIELHRPLGYTNKPVSHHPRSHSCQPLPRQPSFLP